MGVFKQLESLADGQSVPLSTALEGLPWNADGLVPAIAQQFDTGEVLIGVVMLTLIVSYLYAIFVTPVMSELFPAILKEAQTLSTVDHADIRG